MALKAIPMKGRLSGKKVRGYLWAGPDMSWVRKGFQLEDDRLVLAVLVPPHNRKRECLHFDFLAEVIAHMVEHRATEVYVGVILLPDGTVNVALFKERPSDENIAATQKAVNELWEKDAR